MQEDETETISIDTFRVLRLVRDPAFYAALLTLIAGAVPEVSEWLTDNWIILTPLLTVLAGHFVVRAKSADALGRFAAGMPTRVELSDLLPDTVEALMLGADEAALDELLNDEEEAGDDE